MFGRLKEFLLDPYALRTFSQKMVRRLNIGSYERRLEIGAVERPHYGHCIYNAAMLAKKLGYPRFTVIEFGVAGGNGLVNAEWHAREVSKLVGIGIDIYGFDTGEGLPEPLDYRDLPYHWKRGFFKMDVPSLQARLTSARLILGNIEETSLDFFNQYDPAPIGAVMHDFDFYSSTAVALKMFEAPDRYYLPRVFCYFDDTIGTEIESYNDYTGQRLAINEFNDNHQDIKLGLPYYLLARQIVESWYHKIRICHFFNHHRYNDFISTEDQQLACR